MLIIYLTLSLVGFDQVFLSLIYDIKSEQDAKDVIAEFNSLLGVRLLSCSKIYMFQNADKHLDQEEHPSNKYQLGGVPGVKGIFAEIEGFVSWSTGEIFSL